MAADSDEVFVDLSNVVKHELLGFSHHHAALSRWDRLRAEWLRSRGNPKRFIIVADDSLPRALSRPDQLRLQDLISRGDAILSDNADVELLKRAVRASGTVLSNDRFVDHLRMPGIEKVSRVGWAVRGAHILLIQQPLERLRSAIISARAHKQLLKHAGLDADSPQLRFQWFCRDSTCVADLVPVPVIERGTALCPSCGAHLEQGPRWRAPIWIKIMHDQQEVNRFVLEDGESVYVGRGVDDETVSLADDFDHAADVLALDLRHVQLRNRDGRLYVIGQETAKGTALRYPVAGQRNLFSPPAPLSSGEEKLVPLGWKIVLARTPYLVQISGRQGLA